MAGDPEQPPGATPDEFRAITGVDNNPDRPPIGVAVTPEAVAAHRAQAAEDANGSLQQLAGGEADGAEDRANAPLVHGIAEGVKSKDTTPLSPEQQKIQQTIDKLKQQNEQLGGKMLTVLKSDTGEFYLLNAYSENDMDRVLNLDPDKPIGYVTVAGVDSGVGPVIIAGGVSRVLAEEVIDRADDEAGRLNVDALIRERGGHFSFTRVTSEANLNKFAKLHAEAIRRVQKSNEQRKVKGEYAAKTLDVVSSGDQLIAAGKK